MTKSHQIKNCLYDSNKPKFSYECPLKWSALNKTKDPKKRFCETCKSSVYLVSENDELALAKRAGLCIAWANKPIQSLNADRYKNIVMGRPEGSQWFSKV